MSRIMDLLAALQAETDRPAEDAAPAVVPVAPGARPRAAASFVEHFGLRENPFADAIDLGYFYRGAAQEEALERMASTVRDGLSLGLVTGPPGSGKTVVSQLLLRRLEGSATLPVLVAAAPETGPTALLREILRESGAAALPATRRGLLEALQGRMLELRRAGRRLVILIDEAQFLRSESLHLLRTLSNLETPREKLCTCLLFAEERFRRRLEHPIHRSLATRMYHRARLRTLEAEEVAQYVRFRVMVAGGDPGVFGEDALAAIAAVSGGVCREVSRLAYLALEAGWRRGRDAVGPDLVEGA
jgi:type II secretory pathway predicted ATPase ExeA